MVLNATLVYAQQHFLLTGAIIIPLFPIYWALYNDYFFNLKYLHFFYKTC